MIVADTVHRHLDAAHAAEDRGDDAAWARHRDAAYAAMTALTPTAKLALLLHIIRGES